MPRRRRRRQVRGDGSGKLGLWDVEEVLHGVQSLARSGQQALAMAQVGPGGRIGCLKTTTKRSPACVCASVRACVCVRVCVRRTWARGGAQTQKAIKRLWGQLVRVSRGGRGGVVRFQARAVGLIRACGACTACTAHCCRSFRHGVDATVWHGCRCLRCVLCCRAVCWTCWWSGWRPGPTPAAGREVAAAAVRATLWFGPHARC